MPSTGRTQDADSEAARSLQDRDAALHEAFTDAFFEDVTILESIPNGSALFLIPKDDPELAEMNMLGALDAARNGYDVYIRHMPQATPTK